MLRMLVVRELWSLWLSRKMDINFDRKIISNTNRQYLVLPRDQSKFSLDHAQSL